ncbi:keratin, type II cytoskeletal 8 isoform X2 [Brienomyrus brachyistius]|uniref:keratin, type II cytoskeletal 8 isoform X2 n=1 Tax=Brienomyrus brachyistius TaxID=42636 RepID=UPI0020B33B29|nr:keratin, type II cytoskeletal 8 isoform X2 [Brienomyrus brachyistius]
MSLRTKQFSSFSTVSSKGKSSSFSTVSSKGKSGSFSSSSFSGASYYGVGPRFGWSPSVKQTSMPCGLHPGSHISSVNVNWNLLDPLNFEVDPTFCAVRNQEKEQIKSLNNRFASFINKVRHLEQQNKLLETKWNLLKQESSDDSQVEMMYEDYIARLHYQLDALSIEKNRLDGGLKDVFVQVESCKQRFEDEINKKATLENEFVILKKDVDHALLAKTELDEEAEALNEKIYFLKTIYDQELTELEASIKDTSVTVRMDNSRDINMEDIIADVKAQYEYVATKSREEAELWYKAKVHAMSKNANYYDKELSTSKNELAELRRKITRTESEIETVKGQQGHLDSDITKAKAKGTEELEKAWKHIRSLEKNLNEKKKALASQLKDYQELMNCKMALDIEIATYKKLLEGEEFRIGHEYAVDIHPGTHTCK